MKLTRRENPQGIKRWNHLNPAPFWVSRCDERCPDTRHTCTLADGHRGPHAAHGALRRTVAVWRIEGAEKGRVSDTRPRKKRREVEPAFDESWLVAGLKDLAKRLALSSVEDLRGELTWPHSFAR